MEEVLYSEGDEAMAQTQQKVVDASSLKVFKARLDGILGSLIWWVAASPQQGVGLGRL